MRRPRNSLTTPEAKAAAARESSRRTRENMPYRQRLAYSLRQWYGITIEQYDAMRERQGYACATCGTPESECRIPNQQDQPCRLTVDHNHVTGEVRGLLCNRCNAGLGNLREEPEIMRSLIRYIEQYPGPYAGERSSRKATHKPAVERQTMLEIA